MTKRLNRSGPNFVWDLTFPQGRFMNDQHFKYLSPSKFYLSGPDVGSVLILGPDVRSVLTLDPDLLTVFIPGPDVRSVLSPGSDVRSVLTSRSRCLIRPYSWPRC